MNRFEALMDQMEFAWQCPDGLSCPAHSRDQSELIYNVRTDQRLWCLGHNLAVAGAMDYAYRLGINDGVTLTDELAQPFIVPLP